jgi:rubrerythrin
MSEQQKPDAVDKMVEAYELMLKRTHEGIEHAEKETVPALRELLEKTRDNMVELGELTREEAAKVADYVERDIKEAAAYIAQTGEDLRQWWRFDLDQIEQRMLEMFTAVADQTSLQLRNWAEQARRASRYRTGEVSGPGTLVCAGCGAEMHMSKARRIPPCPKCGATEFRRAGVDEAGIS